MPSIAHEIPLFTNTTNALKTKLKQSLSLSSSEEEAVVVEEEEEEEEEEDNRANDEKRNFGDVMRCERNENVLMSWRMKKKKRKNAVQISRWESVSSSSSSSSLVGFSDHDLNREKKEKNVERTKNAKIEIVFPSECICSNAIAMRELPGEEEMYEIIACDEEVRNNGKSLSIYVARVLFLNRDCDVSGAFEIVGDVLRKEIRLESSCVGDLVTSVGLVCGNCCVDSSSAVLCVGGKDGRKVAFVDVSSASEISEISTSSVSASTLSYGSALLGKFGFGGSAQRIAPIVYISPRPVKLDGAYVTVIVSADGAVTCVTNASSNNVAAFASNNQANRRVLFRMVVPKGALKSDPNSFNVDINGIQSSQQQDWFVSGARATDDGSLVIFGYEEGDGRKHVTAYTFISSSEIRRVATFPITSADSVRDVYFVPESREIFVLFSSNCVSKWSGVGSDTPSLAIVETLEADLARFESWAIKGVGSEASLQALKISFFGSLSSATTAGIDKSEMKAFAKILASEIAEIGLDHGVSLTSIRRALGNSNNADFSQQFETDVSILDFIATSLATSSQSIEELIEKWKAFVEAYVTEWTSGNYGIAFCSVPAATSQSSKSSSAAELLFLRKSGVSVLPTKIDVSSQSGTTMRFKNDSVESTVSLLSRAAGNSIERMATLLGCNFCGLENREAVDWLEVAASEATGFGKVTSINTSNCNAKDIMFRDQRRLLQRQTILSLRKSWESLMVNDADLGACVESIELALSQSVFDIASSPPSSTESLASAKTLRMVAHKAFGFVIFLRLASKGRAYMVPKEISNEAFSLLPRVLLVFSLSSALSSVCALDAHTIAIQAFAKQQGDPAKVVVDLFRRGEIEASERIALAFLGSAIPGDFEKKTDDDESLKGERPALTFARALVMLTKKSQTYSAEATRLFFQSALRLENVDDEENQILADTARTIRAALVGARRPDTILFDSLEHYETVALAYESISSSHVSQASLKFTIAAISEAELITEFESPEDFAKLVDAKERLWHASLRRACEQNDFVSAFVSTLYLHDTPEAARHSNYSGVRALVAAACDSMGVDSGASLDVGRVIRSLPFGEALIAVKETLERKSRTHKSATNDASSSQIVSPSELLYSLHVDRWELRDAALVAAHDAVRVGEESRRKVCEAMEQPQNVQIRNLAIASIEKYLHCLEKSLAALAASKSSDRCDTGEGESFFEPSFDDFEEEEEEETGNDDRINLALLKDRTRKKKEIDSRDSSSDEIIFENLRIVDDKIYKTQKQPSDRSIASNPKRHKKLHPPTGDDEIGVGSPFAAMARLVALVNARLIMLRNGAFLEEIAITKQKLSNVANLFDERAVKTVYENLLRRGLYDECADLVSQWFSNHGLREIACEIACCAGAMAAEMIRSSSNKNKLRIGFRCVKVSNSLSDSSRSVALNNPWISARKVCEKFENVETNGEISYSACLGALSVNHELELPSFLTDNVHSDKLISLYLTKNRPACAARIALKQLKSSQKRNATKRVKHSASWMPYDLFQATLEALKQPFQSKHIYLAEALQTALDVEKQAKVKDAKTLLDLFTMS